MADITANLKAFKEEIESYFGLSVVRTRRDFPAVKQSKPTQELLAWEMYMDKATLSRKLKGGKQYLDGKEVRNIGSILIYWKCITRRSQLQRLFDLGGCPLSESDWQAEPWNSLVDDTPPPKEAMQQANLESCKDSQPVSPETPEIHNLPFPRNPLFTGRKAQIEQLDQLFNENDTQPVAICGLGGVGKTQLALEYAHRRHPSVYRAVLWVDAVNEETLQSSYKDLADLLELPSDPDQHAQAMKAWLEAHTNWLLILDNVEDLKCARSFLPIKHHGHILLTTRSQIVGNVARLIEVERMESEDGILFLLKRARILQDENELNMVAANVHGTAFQLVRHLGGLPLALDQAGAFIEEAEVSLADYLQLYEEESRYLLNRRGSDYGEHPETIVETVVKLSFTQACKQHPLVADMLHFCAFLPFDGIEEMFHQADSPTPDTASFNEVIAILRRYSLIKRNTKRKILSMHQLVQMILRDNMPPELRAQWRERALRALVGGWKERGEENTDEDPEAGIFLCGEFSHEELAQLFQMD